MAKTHLARKYGKLGMEKAMSIRGSYRQLGMADRQNRGEGYREELLSAPLIRANRKVRDEAGAVVERGMPIEQMQKFLGHWTLETTQRSAEASPERLRYGSTLSGHWHGEQFCPLPKHSTCLGGSGWGYKIGLTPAEAKRTMSHTHDIPRAALERHTPAARGAPSGARGWRPWPCES